MTKTMPVNAAVRNGDENDAKSVATAVTMATSQIASTADAVTSCRSTGGGHRQEPRQAGDERPPRE